MNPDQIEEAVKANNLNAPRVSKDDLAPYQQRVVVECEELGEKIAKLSAFLSQSPAPQLSSEDVYDLNKQLEAMGEYLTVLRRRIERF